jgi:hypothetical protein
MRFPEPNTDALIAWCARHGLDANEIPLEEPDHWLDRDGATHYRLRRLLPSRVEDGDLRWESVEVVTLDRMPPLYVIEATS